MSELQIMRDERQKNELLLNQEFFQKDFNINFHKSVRNVILLTILLGGFLAWCSAGTESNIYLFLSNYNLDVSESNALFLVIGFLILMISLFSFPITVKNTYKKIEVEALLFSSTQSEIFKNFICTKLSYLDSTPITNIQDVFKYIKTEKAEDIAFTEIEFEKYLSSYLQKKRIIMSALFYGRYAKLILLNQCIEKTLVQIKSNPYGEYILITKDNYSIL
ncbi:hypothetical protein [Paenibacillus taichungensis]|uniref:hypothetical protein n=1 Tax=Paenibacillus taichungensis TaxID=484184 RepID=UPI0039A65756